MPPRSPRRPAATRCLAGLCATVLGADTLFGQTVEVPPLPTPVASVPATPAVTTTLQEPPKNGTAEPTKPTVTSETKLSLAECIAIGLERQPNLKAAQHSLAATELGRQALNNLRKGTALLSPDIPIRKQQADRGVAVACAEVQKVHNETVYDITRMYYTFIYARQQEQTATDVIAPLEVFKKFIEDILKSGVVDPKVKVTQFSLYAIQDVIFEVRKQRVAASSGQKASLQALKEAMGVDPSFDFVPKDTELPIMAGEITQESVVEMALCRRPELVQAAAGVDAFRLEIAAQDKIRTRQIVPTLGAGSDLHARSVPIAVRNGEYKPGALSPEMPTNLVGKRDDRVARATEYSLRQDALYEKTLNLVRLEAINSFLTWESTNERMKEAKARFDNARKQVEDARKAQAARQDPEFVIRTEALAGKAQAEYVEAVYEHLKALATLERVTAGGVRPAFPGR